MLADLSTGCGSYLQYSGVFIKIYCKEIMYSMFKDKLQNSSLNQYE